VIAEAYAAPNEKYTTQRKSNISLKKYIPFQFNNPKVPVSSRE
jgi:hypothetical protein